MTRNFPAGGTVPNSHIGHHGHDTLRVTIKGRDGIMACINRDDLEPCLNEGLLEVVALPRSSWKKPASLRRSHSS